MDEITGLVVLALPGPSGLTIALQTERGARVALASGPLAGQLAGTMLPGETWTLLVDPHARVHRATYLAPAPTPAP